MNTAGSSQRSPSLPAAPDGSARLADALGIDQRADPDDRTVISQRPPLPPSSSSRPTAPFELGKLLAGERLNHFELREYVGGGGMGAVFRALDTMLNREVALKVLSRDQGADEETRRRFQNEAQSAARLDHENIARVFYVGEDKGLNYIVFEFIEGVNLREFVEQKGPLPLAEAISYTLQVAEALAHASGRDVVHRDIKPSNVIITDDGRAKLVDMGLARLHQVQPDGEDLTASGVTLGTFDYISPEQARDPRSADVRSDIYSLGCTLYFMLTGRPPFPEGTVLQKLLQHNSDAPPDPRELNPELPAELSELIRKMLAKDPRRRYQHPSELIAELYLLAEQIGCPPPSPSRPTWLAPTPAPRISVVERHLPWIIPVAALLAIVALLDRWQTAEPDETPVEKRTELASQTGLVATTQGGSSSRRGDPNSAKRNANGERRAPEEATPNTSDARTPAAVPESSSREPVGDPEAPMNGGESEADVAEKPRKVAEPGNEESSEEARKTPVDNILKPSDDADFTANAKEHVPSPSPPVTPGSESAAKLPLPLEELPPGILAVCDEPGPQRFTSLSAACAAAKSGDVIELRYSGRRAEVPLSLANLRLTIRSKEGFQPVIAFRPSDADPYNFPHSMLRIAGGTLKLVNLAVELEMPRGVPSENWSLIEAQLVESLTLEKCLLTVKNASDQFGAYHDKVSFFQLKAAPGADAMMPKGMMALAPTEIRLEDCTARGEAVLLRDDDAQPFRLSWKNGLLATSEWLLSAGGATTVPASSGGSTAKMRLELTHLTVAVGQGLCRMWNSYSSPGLLEADIRCTDSVLLSASPGATLIEQICVETPGETQRRIRWEGDRNIYNGLSTFWRIGDANSTVGRQNLSFDDWKAYWGSNEVQPSVWPITWKRQTAEQLPPNARTVADYTIDDRAENTAIHDTTDGELIGLNPTMLPGWVWKADAPALDQSNARSSSGDSPELD